MQISDWNTRWQNNQIGFHEAKPNACLTTHIEQFNLLQGATVFVPLCGKSNDLFWLAKQGYQVIGIECSSLAVEDFFKEHQLEPLKETIDHFTVYKSNNITIYQGDFFKLNQNHFELCDLIYDRASLVAFPADQRAQYVSHLKQWFSENTQLFLITLTYDQEIMSGPPFSVPREEVETHYKYKNIQQIRQFDAIDEGPKWRKSGLTSLLDTAFKISEQ